MAERTEPLEALFDTPEDEIRSGLTEVFQWIETHKIIAAGNLGTVAMAAAIVARAVPLYIAANTGLMTYSNEFLLGGHVSLWAAKRLDKVGQRLAGPALAQGWEPTNLRIVGDVLEYCGGQADIRIGSVATGARHVEAWLRSESNDYWSEQRTQFHNELPYLGHVATSAMVAYELMPATDPQTIRLAAGIAAALVASLTYHHALDVTAPDLDTDIMSNSNLETPPEDDGLNTDFMLD